MTLDDLIARLERAEGPDTRLDDEIMWALGDWINEGGWWRRHKVTGQRESYTYREAPRYTASLDAALALVPLYGARIQRPIPGGFDEKELGAGEHRTSAALALCIASLKARRGA